MKMADVINRAINEHLSDGAPENSGQIIFSCNAIYYSINYFDGLPVLSFLESLGVAINSPDEFNDIPFGEKRQFARALWLTWAAMIAREEGITI